MHIFIYICKSVCSSTANQGRCFFVHGFCVTSVQSHYTLHATSLKMLDFFSIFSKGGIVLWYFQGTSQLFTPPINALIKSVILQVSLSHVYLMRQPHLTYGEITSSSCPVITNKLVYRKLSSVLVKLFMAHYEISFIWNSNERWTFDFDKLDHHQNSQSPLHIENMEFPRVFFLKGNWFFFKLKKVFHMR